MAAEIKKQKVVVVGPDRFPVRNSRTSGSGVVARRLVMALGYMRDKVGVHCIVAAGSDGMENSTVVLQLPSAYTEGGHDRRVSYGWETWDADFDPHAEPIAYYRKVKAAILALPYRPDHIIFNDLGTHAHLLEGIDAGRIHNLVHLDQGQYLSDAIGDIRISNYAVGLGQYERAPNRYAGCLENPTGLVHTQKQAHVWPPKNAVFLGRVDRVKGLDLAIAACKAMRESGWAPDLRLHVMGPIDPHHGHYYARQHLFENRAETAHFVTYYGEGDNCMMSRILDDADLGFFTSNPRSFDGSRNSPWREAFGLVAAEMLAARVPVFGFDNVGLLSHCKSPQAVATIPWQERWNDRFNPRLDDFGCLALERLQHFTPDPQKCRDLVAHLGLELYGPRVMALLNRKRLGIPKQK